MQVKIGYYLVALYMALYVVMRFIVKVILTEKIEADKILLFELIFITFGDSLMGLFLTIEFVKIIKFMKSRANLEYRIHIKSMSLTYASLILYTCSRLFEYSLYFYLDNYDIHDRVKNITVR